LLSESQFASYLGDGTSTVSLGPVIRYGPNMLPPGVVDGSTVFASGTVRVVYSYDPLPAPICMATSNCPCQGTACPCTSPAAGHGCTNSASSQGGLLATSGEASLSADTLLLSGTSMPDSFALYVQGDSFVYVQHPFGDGLRCITGSLVRLGARANAGGSSHYPAAGGLPVSVRGGVTAPGTRTYQTFYRDPAEYCTSSTLNATNGMAIVWGP
jgi:hypothetical protein